MARKPAPHLYDQINPIRQVALELRLRADLGQPLDAGRALEMSATLEASIEAIATSIVKARNALTYGAEYDPLDA